MQESKVSFLVAKFQSEIPADKVGYLKKHLDDAPDKSFDNIQLVKTTNPIVVLILSIFLGWIGIDRFVIGDVGLGICKLLFGTWTLGIWWLVDIFFSYKKCKEKNLQNIIMCL